VLLSRLPYDKNGDEFFMPAIARYWVRLGYAVVVQDVRGKARSGGEFDPAQQEVDDGYDTIEWIVAQPWSRGRVAMIGDSYAGYTQWAAAQSGHPALVAITPRCATHDRVDLMCNGGVLAVESAVYWAAETALDEFLYDFPQPFDWSARPVRDVFVTETGRDVPAWLDDVAADNLDHEAAPPTIRDDLRCLHTFGLYDIAVGAQFNSWRLASRSSAGSHHLVVDAVDHSWRALMRSGDPAGSLEAMSPFLERYHEPMRDFLAAAFAGDDYGEPAVRWRTGVVAPWTGATAWPPPDAHPATWWATRREGAGVGALEASMGADPSEIGWTHDPDRPLPSRGSPFHELVERPDQADLATRPDVVQFETDYLPRNLTLVGDAVVEAEYSFAGAWAHLFAVLLDVDPDGVSREIRYGRQRVRGAGRGRAVVELGPLAYDLGAGHRLALRLSSSLFPRCSLDSGNSSLCWKATSPSASQRRVILGGPTGARLTCAVLESMRCA
jgi:uncharacterized protein